MMREGRIISAAVAADMANPDFDACGYRILVTRLSPFRDIEVSYSHLVLFGEARRALPDAFIDFAFLPSAQDRKSLSAEKRPWFHGRASGRAPSEFNLILISCAFTLELVNLPWLLVQSGIPLSRAERIGGSNFPLLILGGSSAVTAGSLLRMDGGRVQDSLVDGIFFGEGEGHISNLVRITADCRGGGLTKDATLARIADRVPGFWPCDADHRTVRALSARRPAVLTSPLILNGENADRAKLAITAGCTGHCAFCLEGWDRRPFREQSLSDISASALLLKKSTGATDVELFSYNFNMHHEVESIIPAVGRYFQRVSLMSQRLDVLARSPSLLSAEIAAGKRSFTLGIEGISERMRRYYRKGIGLDDIQKSASGILARGGRELKLFYIIAGSEENRDFIEFQEFLDVLALMKRDARAHTRIIVSAGYLVRLPFTPLQFAPLAADRERLSEISRRLETACTEAGMEFRLAVTFDDYWADQLLSIAGPAAHTWLSACPDLDYVYDMHLSRGATRALEEQMYIACDFSALLAEKPAEYRPCFSFTESEQHWQLLRSHYENSREAHSEARSQVHRASLSKERGSSFIVRATKPAAQRAISTIAAQEAAKAHFSPIFVRVVEGEIMAFSTPEYERSWLIRSLAALVPNSERAIFDCHLAFPNARWSSLFSENTQNRFGLCGEKYFALYGPDSSAIKHIIGMATKALTPPLGMASEATSSGNPSNRHTPRPTLPGSVAALVQIEWIDEIPSAEYCTLLYTVPSDDTKILAERIELWLREQDLQYIVKKTENGSEFLISGSAGFKKSVQDIQYNTYSSSIELKIRIGPRADLQKLSELLLAAWPADEVVFTVDSWA